MKEIRFSRDEPALVFALLACYHKTYMSSEAIERNEFLMLPEFIQVKSHTLYVCVLELN